MSQVSGNVVTVNSPSISDEAGDGTLKRVVTAATEVVTAYDSDGVVPQHSTGDLLSAVRKGLELANATAGPDILVLVTDGNTDGVDKRAVRAGLDELDDETMVVFVVVSNQPHEIDRDFLDELDDKHAKASQIDVIYTGDENITDVFGREVLPFLSSVAGR